MARIAYAKFDENDSFVKQELFEEGQTPEGETWLPVVVETQDYNRLTHHETGRGTRREGDKAIRYRIIEPITVTADMVKAECQRRIIAYTGGGDLTGSLVRQFNANGALQPEIDRLREISNKIEKMNPIPIDFRDDKFWMLQ
jgi:hypothetical protein